MHRIMDISTDPSLYSTDTLPRLISVQQKVHLKLSIVLIDRTTGSNIENSGTGKRN